MIKVSDSTLVKKAKRHDFKAFEELVNRYETKVYNLAYKMLGSREDAKDVLQDTFMSAFKSLDRFKEKSSFSTWIYRIATNACLMKFRERKPQIVSLDDRPFTTSKEIMDWSKNPAAILEHEELKRVMDRMIKSLPAQYRTVFVLRDVEGLSNSQTAKVLRISIGAVKSRLHRARLYLREKLSAYFKRM
ncbi:MAG: sigma-70 family RNA polymerase sigma factor [bacterium]|nr:sigma-70 family RNA polymerase sigma factor [bacterium]